MATDLETLVVQLSADYKKFEVAMGKANGVMAKQLREIERNAAKTSKKLDSIFSGIASRLVAPLGGIGAALGTREILRYADAWTSAKNSLAVAGVVGNEQKQVLDQLYQSAQSNAAPITALTDLYGKAAQASDNLGASQSDLLKFSDGVAVALRVAGTSASQASGALTQLGQLLGQARVQAEEFNSVNEGARPILMAVANGLDAAGGSVSKLKALVTDGKVSGQQFFQAFLKGLPTIQAMAANATQTIEQGITKVNNAFTKYIGESDESLGASQRLVQALNALADNFGHTADMVLKVAGIIAGALVGRSLAGMIRSLGLATSAMWTFVGALRSASSASGLVTAFGGLGSAAGPLGTLIGGTVVGALSLYSMNAAEASQKSKKFEGDLEALGLLAPRVATGVDAAAKSIKDLAGAGSAQKLRSIADELDRIRTGGNFGNAGDELSAIQARARSSVFDLFSDDSADSKARTEIVELAHLLQGMQVTTEEVRRRMDAIRSTPISDAVKDMADELDRTAQKIAGLQAQSLSLGVMPGMDDAKEQLDAVINDLDRLEQREIITAEQRKNLEEALTKLRDTGKGADEARAALAAIGGVSFSTALVGLDGLINKVAVLYSQAAQAKALLDGMSVQSGPSFRELEDKSMEAYREMKKVGDDFIKDAQKRNSLTKDQLALENEIAKVRKDAEKAGAVLTDGQIKELAQANLAADKRRSEEGKKPKKEKAVKKSTDQMVDSDIQAVRDRIAAMQLETEIVGKSYQEQEKRRMSLELEQQALAKLRDEAIKKGQTDLSNITISAEQRAKIDEISDAYARQAEELRKVQDQQDRAEQASMEFYDSFKSSISNLITGADSLADALENILGKLADLALNSAFDALFKPSSGGVAGGSFGGIFDWIGGLFRKDGGPVKAATGGYISGPGGPRSDSIPAMLSNGEYVVNAAATKKFGPVLDAINSGKGLALAGGGPVLRAPTLPSIQGARQSASSGAMRVDVGVSVDNDGNLQAYVQNISRKTSQSAIRSYDKTGPARLKRDSRQANMRGMV